MTRLCLGLSGTRKTRFNPGRISAPHEEVVKPVRSGLYRGQTHRPKGPPKNHHQPVKQGPCCHQ